MTGFAAFAILLILGFFGLLGALIYIMINWDQFTVRTNQRGWN